ncbi:PadR family transcriptional regulator [Nostocoides sp. HKS02]|uniref:PadR family transcriptional regulator n=1 Tax=Nostocoides sp. HKS02 TaxID=1813880 RepID=UPI0012B49A7E|nr:PadR family transcriptional regulator [Tetrasphaera sp. HKS02]QGN58660.1 PadR family transcriptional regulator [Tetrasphaera sp. HKS02]
MSRRSELLEFAVLGLLHESPMHGYELRKRLNAALGVFRALSYGTLYPCLRGLLDRGWITEATGPRATAAATAGSKRARIVYELTAEGKEQFQELAKQAGPTAWEDDTFDVHFAFFARTEAEVRLRILEGRRSRLEERLANIRTTSAKNRERIDSYTAALQQHGEDAAEREVRWLNELITAERNIPERTIPAAPATRHTPSSTTTASPTRNKE